MKTQMTCLLPKDIGIKMVPKGCGFLGHHTAIGAKAIQKFGATAGDLIVLENDTGGREEVGAHGSRGSEDQEDQVPGFVWGTSGDVFLICANNYQKYLKIPQKSPKNKWVANALSLQEKTDS